jgi:hypothetical protein
VGDGKRDDGDGVQAAREQRLDAVHLVHVSQTGHGHHAEHQDADAAAEVAAVDRDKKLPDENGIRAHVDTRADGVCDVAPTGK